MAVFNFDSEMLMEHAMQAAADALNTANTLSQDKFNEIANKINEAFPGVIEVLTNEAEDYWKNKAMSIGSWGSKYVKAIKSDVSNGVGTVYLDESEMDRVSGKPLFMFAMMVEEGVKSWSIKDALLNSRKAKVGKDGIKYITIPFPVSAPRKSGQGKMQSGFGGREMTSEMRDILRSGGQVSGSISVGSKKVSMAGLTQFSTQKYHSQFGLFRRVSSKSKGWIYPNKAPIPVFTHVKAYMDKRVAEIMSDFCKAIVMEAMA